jgi:23S rRNA (guanosine2251-2'-O)-methyltransferase
MLIIGINPVLEILKVNPESVHGITCLDTKMHSVKVKDILRLAKKNNITVNFTNKNSFSGLFISKDKSEGISQGIFAVVADFKYYDEQELFNELKRSNKVMLLILDEIQDPHNLGAVIRTGAAVGVDGIILTEKNTVKVNHTVIKASSGTILGQKIILSKNIYKTIESLKKLKIRIIGTSLSAESSHYNTDFNTPCAILLGNEQKGIRTNLLKLCDDVIKIPIPGTAESLNVSVSAGVILYEALRQRG